VRGLLLPIAVVVAAEIAARTIGIKLDNLAAPSAILVAGFDILLDGSLLYSTSQTLWAALAGLAIGGGLGLMLGILIGLSAPLARLLQVTIEALRPIPSIALLPIALLIFGFGFGLEISLVAFSTFWPVVIITQAAIAGIEPMLMEVSRALGLGTLSRIVKIMIPAMLPRIFVAFRLAAGIALIVAVTAEIVNNPIGLGTDLNNAQQVMRPATMFAVLIWVGIVGWALNAALLFAQRRLFGRAATLEVPP
jgi:ABC-type nitrate/sulfonate/bicarbonate transport system permease component